MTEDASVWLSHLWAALPWLVVAFGFPIVAGWWIGDWDDFA